MPSFCWVEWAPRLLSSVLQTKIKVSGDREILPPTVSPVAHHLLQASLTSLRAASQQPPAVGVAFSDPLVAGASPLLHGASLLSVDPPLRTSPTVPGNIVLSLFCYPPYSVFLDLLKIQL